LKADSNAEIAPGLARTDFARALWEDPEAAKRAVAAYPIGLAVSSPGTHW